MPYSPRPEFYQEKLAENRTAMFSDLYTWAMAQALFNLGLHNTMASFDAHVRKGEMLLSGGQNITAEYVDKKWMKSKDSTFERLKRYSVLDPNTNTMKPIFTPEFIELARTSKNEMTINMVPEGGLVYGMWATNRAPIWQGLIAEDYFLNPFNSQSMFVTKAARLKMAANGKPMIDMALRRSLAIGGLEVSRGAYIGGFDTTSNMEAWEAYDIPMAGTVAHAGMMFFKDDEEACEQFFISIPHNTCALPDTYGDTLEGLRRAIRADAKVREATHLKIVMKAARLDSGDLVRLSNECRKLLDDAGLQHVKIIPTSELDEPQLADLEKNGSADLYGVGTKLALNTVGVGGVYKLNTVYGPGITAEMIDLYEQAKQSGTPPTPEDLDKFMREVIKLGEKAKENEPQKATYPGEKAILRTLFRDSAGWHYGGDIVVPALEKLPVRMVDNPQGPYEGILTEDVSVVMPNDPSRRKVFLAGTHVMLPLKPTFNIGALVGTIETVQEARQRVKSELSLLAPENKRLSDPKRYEVWLAEGLYNKWQSKIAAIRAMNP